MHILLVAATTFEIQPVINLLQDNRNGIAGHTVEVLITGVGLLHTTFQLTRHLGQGRPDLAIQAGIGGSFSPDLTHGQVVLVERELVGDLGVEENGVFRDIVDMGFLAAGERPYTGKWLVNPTASNWSRLGLPFAQGNTINEITTRTERIAQLQQKYAVTVESMEGAAFHYVALQTPVPFLQLRAISNYVGERDKSKWRIKEAITALNDTLIHVLKGLSS